jgi:HEAT repeat protein
MKTTLLITVLISNLVLAGNSFAAKFCNSEAIDKLQPDPSTPIFIIQSELVDQETLKEVLQKLDDPDPFVRVEAVQALGEIQIKQSLVSACECLLDDNLYVRAYAAEALGKIGMMDVTFTLSKLFAALHDPSPYARAKVIAALGELKDERAIAPLKEMLQDQDESVRGMAAWALNKIENTQ